MACAEIDQVRIVSCEDQFDDEKGKMIEDWKLSEDYLFGIMSDIFFPEDVTKLLTNKNVLFLGGSVVRGLYKDLCWLINSKSLIPYEVNTITQFQNKF